MTFSITSIDHLDQGLDADVEGFADGVCHAGQQTGKRNALLWNRQFGAGWR